QVGGHRPGGAGGQGEQPGEQRRQQAAGHRSTLRFGDGQVTPHGKSTARAGQGEDATSPPLVPLVPKRSLGTHLSETPFRPPAATGNSVSRTGVPKRDNVLQRCPQGEGWKGVRVHASLPEES